jgi:transcriptional regulator with GAF, ATPase, and Fis domain
MRDDAVVHEIVNQIAERQGVGPTEVEPPLHEVIDVDTLRTLTSEAQKPGVDRRVEFLYSGYVVVVDGAGRVTIDEPTSPTSSASGKPRAESPENLQAEIEHREDALHQASAIVGAHDLPFDTQIDGLLEVIRNALSMEYGTLSYVDTDTYVFEAVNSASGLIEAGEEVPLRQAVNCERVVETEQSLVLADIEQEAPELVDSTWGVTSYIGVPVYVDETLYGTFCFFDTGAKREGFSDWDLAFVELLSNWVSGELEKRQ